MRDVLGSAAAGRAASRWAAAVAVVVAVVAHLVVGAVRIIVVNWRRRLVAIAPVAYPPTCRTVGGGIGVSLRLLGGLLLARDLAVADAQLLGSGTISPPPALRVSPGKHPGTIEQ